MKTITCAELEEALQGNNPPILVDVRNPDEVSEGCIPQAKNIPLHVLPLTAAQELPNKDAFIVINCQSGGRSGQACTFLEKNGYSNVVNLEGGFDAYCARQ